MGKIGAYPNGVLVLHPSWSDYPVGVFREAEAVLSPQTSIAARATEGLLSQTDLVHPYIHKKLGVALDGAPVSIPSTLKEIWRRAEANAFVDAGTCRMGFVPDEGFQ